MNIHVKTQKTFLLKNIFSWIIAVGQSWAFENGGDFQRWAYFQFFYTFQNGPIFKMVHPKMPRSAVGRLGYLPVGYLPARRVHILSQHTVDRKQSFKRQYACSNNNEALSNAAGKFRLEILWTK